MSHVSKARLMILVFYGPIAVALFPVVVLVIGVFFASIMLRESYIGTMHQAKVEDEFRE
jgi:hypothetical protein